MLIYILKTTEKYSKPTIIDFEFKNFPVLFSGSYKSKRLTILR